VPFKIKNLRIHISSIDYRSFAIVLIAVKFCTVNAAIQAIFQLKNQSLL